MSSGKGSILLVDDDPGILLTVGDQLQLEGYAVTRADSGRKGLAALQEIRPDLIILDMNMPESGGLAFLNNISRPNGVANYPVLILTARANMERFVAETDVAGFVAKGTKPETLLLEVSRIMSASGKGGVVSPAVKRVLIAEDDVEIAGAVASCFRDDGFSVMCTSSGYDLIEGAVLQRPGYVLLKQALPHMSGSSVASMLSTMPRTQSIRVVCYGVQDVSGQVGKNPHVSIFVPGNKPADLLNAIRGLIPKA